ETFVLKPFARDYREFDPHYGYLFNSYYVTVGDRHCRQNRGQLSRPTVEEVYAYRAHVDRHMTAFLESLTPADEERHRGLLQIGLNHEQQHQELLVTDIKHVFWVNPLRPAYRPEPQRKPAALPPMEWQSFAGGLHKIGHADDGRAFAFDNESPRHTQYLRPFSIASRLVTNGEYKAFLDDGGYDRADVWLSMGAAHARQEAWRAPLYWIDQGGEWVQHTLSGVRPVDDDEPVCHVSYFEADAFARWSGARLPTEAEWEVAAAAIAIDGTFLESERFHPQPAGGPGLRQMFGDVWQWTSSAYLGYPGYQPPAGAIGEYNGKFMCNQFVLRGGSVATPRSHVRATYRNFFPPDARWQFMGLRLAKDAPGPAAVRPLSEDR
ncbi:MAG TPA: ergothioneine biosynthesis protein EgtB, partial [Tepidisphaeraceae bacterium]